MPCPHTERLAYSERLDCPFVEVHDILIDPEEEAKHFLSIEEHDLAMNDAKHGFKEIKQIHREITAIEKWIQSNPFRLGWLTGVGKNNLKMVRFIEKLGAKRYNETENYLYLKKTVKEINVQG